MRKWIKMLDRLIEKYGSVSEYQKLLDKVICYVSNKHMYQTDLSGDPYIHHLLRVAGRVDPEFKIVALMHDVLEDTDAVVEDLYKMGLVKDDIDAIVLLTRLEGVDYLDYVASLRGNRTALTVKLSDLIDNMDRNRPVPDTSVEWMRERRKEFYEPARVMVKSFLKEL